MDDPEAQRVFNFHKNTLHVVKEMIEATGLHHPSELNRRHIVRRISSSKSCLLIKSIPPLPGSLINGEGCDDPRLEVYWDRVTSNSFSPVYN